MRHTGRRTTLTFLAAVLAIAGTNAAQATTVRTCASTSYTMTFTPPVDAGVHAGTYILSADIICYTGSAAVMPLPSASLTPSTFTTTSTGTYTGSCLFATFADSARSGGGYMAGNAIVVTVYLTSDSSTDEVGVLELVPEGICPSVIETATGSGLTVFQNKILTP